MNENLILIITFLTTTTLTVLFFDSEILNYLIIGLVVGNITLILTDKKMSMGFNNGIILMAIFATSALTIFLFHEIIDIIGYSGNIQFFLEHDLHRRITKMFFYYSQSMLIASILTGQVIKK